MKTTQTFGIHFILRTLKNDKENGLVYARITVNGRRIEISMKKTIATNDWNTSKGALLGNGIEARKFNSYLELMRAQITEAYRELQVNKAEITPDKIKSLFMGESVDSHSLLELVEYHNTTQAATLAQGTLKNYLTTKRYLERFVKKQFKKNDVDLMKLNFKFITDFEFFLRDFQPVDHQRPLDNNGVMKHMERFRKMTSWGIKLGWLNQNPFENYKLKFKHSERGFLTQKELQAIENKNFAIERLVLVHDMFVFSCYTGLSFTDANNLSPSEIRTGMDGNKWIISKRQKTNTALKIPLLAQALEILEKYSDHPKSLNRNKVFPLISNQKINSYLKEIADLCGIKKNLTFHIARHTFATTVTLNNGVPIETVSKVMGHTSLKTTQIYARILDHKISEDMGQLGERLAKSKQTPD